MRTRTTARCVLMLVGLFLSTHRATAEDVAEGVSARVFGVRVIDEAFPQMVFGPPPFGGPGTQLMVLVRTTGAAIVRLNAGDSKVTTFAGNKSGNLLKAKNKPVNDEGDKFGFRDSEPLGHYLDEPPRLFARISENAEYAIVQINAPRSPSTEDSELTLEAELVIVVAKKGATVRLENVPLVRGKLEMERYDVAISKAAMEKDFRGQDVFSVDVTLKGAAADNLDKLRFCDADGNEMMQSGIFPQPRRGDSKYRTFRHAFTERVDTATIEFTFLEGHETVRVPLKATQRLGF